MPKTVEAVVDESGQIQLLESLPLRARQRVLVTVLEEEAHEHQQPASETALLSEQALARDWNRSEEEEAWRHLQREQ